MAISEADIKLLWGRAAAFCSRPTCEADLSKILADNVGYNIGEMAHIIARKEKGPRGKKGKGDDTYPNLILLCPSCHRDIDKSPEGTFTVEAIHKWKAEHEANIRHLGGEIVYKNFDTMSSFVANLLEENKAIWSTLGPK